MNSSLLERNAFDLPDALADIEHWLWQRSWGLLWKLYIIACIITISNFPARIRQKLCFTSKPQNTAKLLICCANGTRNKIEPRPAPRWHRLCFLNNLGRCLQTLQWTLRNRILINFPWLSVVSVYSISSWHTDVTSTKEMRNCYRKRLVWWTSIHPHVFQTRRINEGSERAR